MKTLFNFGCRLVKLRGTVSHYRVQEEVYMLYVACKYELLILIIIVAYLLI